VVEQTVVLVVVEDEHGLGPHLGVGRDRLDLGGHVVRAGGGQVVGVLGLVAGRQDPGDGREAVVAGVVLEGAVRLGGHALVVERVAGLGLLERLEQRQHVGAVVVGLLVDLPADAGRLQLLGVGGVGQRGGRGVLDDRAAVGAVGVDRTGHPVQPVGPGRTLHRAEVVVADGEGLGQRELEGDVVAGVVPHHVRPVDTVRLAVGGQPLVHLPVVPGLVLDRPGVAGGGDGLGAGLAGVQVERQQVAVGVDAVGLVEHVAAGAQPQRARVVEAAHAGEGAEVVVEGAVLLHQQDHVLDVAQ
jgi:hypothetical protein